MIHKGGVALENLLTRAALNIFLLFVALHILAHPFAHVFTRKMDAPISLANGIKLAALYRTLVNHLGLYIVLAHLVILNLSLAQESLPTKVTR